MVKIKTVTYRIIGNPFEISDFLVAYFGDAVNRTESGAYFGDAINRTESGRDGEVYISLRDDFAIQISADSVQFVLELPELWDAEMILALSIDELENMSLQDLASRIKEAKEQYKPQHQDDDQQEEEQE